MYLWGHNCDKIPSQDSTLGQVTGLSLLTLSVATYVIVILVVVPKGNNGHSSIYQYTLLRVTVKSSVSILDPFSSINVVVYVVWIIPCGSK